ncbi:MAG: ABC transporter permease [Caulobacteraceae bacterium]
MRRVLRIAAREYMAFVRTAGFWVAICLAPLGLIAAIFFTGAARHATAPPAIAIVDLTGAGYGQALTKALTASHPPPVVVIPAPIGPPASAKEAARLLKPYLRGDRTAPYGLRLDAAAVIHGPPDRPSLDLWTRNVEAPGLQEAVRAALAEAMRQERLRRAGLSPAFIAGLQADQPQVTQFSPKSRAGPVSMRDRLPGVVGFAMGIVLWSLILTGAGILLNSVIEEKQNRILEVLLTSASASEIMGGKMLGAGAVTATALAVWAAVGLGAFGWRDPAMVGQIAALFFGRGLALYFLVYFVGGYLMYAALFTTIGAFCETPREAQTLLGPLMLLLTIPLIFMGQAIGAPDAPLLRALSWIPPFTPFLMAARAASGPPAWEVAGTAALMAATMALELWVAGRAFRTGALASGRFDVRLLVAGIMGRGEG